MRRKEREIKNIETIIEIIKHSCVCRLALNDDEYPYIIPLNYGYRDNALFFHCAPKGKKIDLIQKNNKASFEIEQPYEITKSEISCEWTTKFRSVIGFGTIELLSDFEKKKDGLDIIMQHHGKMENSYKNKAVDNVMILKLSIENISAKQSGD